jgi:hypothetical protein
MGAAMPVKPENRCRYPANWRDIVAQVRERSGNRCEGSPDHPDCRAANGEPHPETGSKVVLTTAHLDHTPEHCDLGNLRHWCQRCHLHYDRHHHAQTAYATRKANANTMELPLDHAQPHCPASRDFRTLALALEQRGEG